MFSFRIVSISMLCGWLLTLAIAYAVQHGAIDAHAAEPKAAAQATRPSKIFPDSEQAPAIFREVDIEAGVVCYTTATGGLDCLPIGQTHLHTDSFYRRTPAK